RSGDPLVIDAGGLLPRPEKVRYIDGLDAAERDESLALVAGLRYDAAAIGSTDLAWGPGYFRRVPGRADIPFVCAGVRDSSGPLAPAMRVIERAGLRIGIIGIFESPCPDAQGAMLAD